MNPDVPDFFNMMTHHPCQSALSVSSGFYFKFRRTHIHNNNSAVYPGTHNGMPPQHVTREPLGSDIVIGTHGSVGDEITLGCIDQAKGEKIIIDGSETRRLSVFFFYR